MNWSSEHPTEKSLRVLTCNKNEIELVKYDLLSRTGQTFFPKKSLNAPKISPEKMAEKNHQRIPQEHTLVNTPSFRFLFGEKFTI